MHNFMLRFTTIMFSALSISGVNSGLVCAQNANIKGDIEYGQYLAGECVTCHSPAGIDKGIPAIIGWEEKSFISVINAYKSKSLENPAMRLIAGRLDDQQIASLALYFASLGNSD